MPATPGRQLPTTPPVARRVLDVPWDRRRALADLVILSCVAACVEFEAEIEIRADCPHGLARFAASLLTGLDDAEVAAAIAELTNRVHELTTHIHEVLDGSPRPQENAD